MLNFKLKKTMKKLISTLIMTFAAVCFTLTASAQTKVFKIDEINANGEEYVGQEVTVEGLCSHLCSHGGRKMFLRGAKGLLRIESSKETGAFSQETVNEPVQVVGKLCETRIDEAYLKAWEEREKGGKAGHDGCETEAAARGEQGNSTAQKIANYRKRIAEREQKEGKAYLSTFYVVAKSYKIL